MRKANYRLLMLGYFSLFALAFMDNLRAPFFEQIMKDYTLTDFTGSFFFSLASLAAFLSSSTSPWILARRNPMDLLRMGFAALALSFFAMTLGGPPSALFFCAAIFGLGVGWISVGEHLAVKAAVNESDRGRAFSGLHSIYAGSSLLGPFLASLFFRNEIHWTVAFRGAAIFPMITLAGTFFLKPHWEESRPEENASENVILRFGDTFSKDFLLYSALLSLYVVGELVISTRLPLLMTREYGVSGEIGAWYLSGFFAFLLLGRLIFSFVTISPLKIFVAYRIVLISTLVILLAGWKIHPLFFCVTGLFLAPFFAMTMDLIARVHSTRADAAMSQAIAVMSLFTVVMHNLVGFLTDRFGIWFALMVCPLAFILALFVVSQISQEIDSPSEPVTKK